MEYHGKGGGGIQWKGWGGSDSGGGGRNTVGRVGGEVIVGAGVGICGRMVEENCIFSLIRFCSSTTSRRTSLICNISSCKRAARIKTNVHVSDKMKSVMRAYLLSVVVPFVISSELLIIYADVGLYGGEGRGDG